MEKNLCGDVALGACCDSYVVTVGYGWRNRLEAVVTTRVVCLKAMSAAALGEGMVVVQDSLMMNLIRAAVWTVVV